MNIFYDFEYNIGTNEPYNVIEDLVPDNKMMVVGLNEPFPELPDDINMIFDLAGAMSEDARSITSAIKQSDVVIVPINNEFKAVKAGIHSLAEVMKYNKNVIVIATKLIKQKTDIFSNNNWRESKDFCDIRAAVHTVFDDSIPVLPLKFSTAFDTIFEREKSVKQICEEDPLLRYAYRVVELQVELIYSEVKKVIKQW